ncbi:MAG: SPFH domain-containing protein [Pseudomonadota bacterium]
MTAPPNIPPPLGWTRLAWGFSIAGIVFGFAVFLWAAFGPLTAWTAPLLACAALGWLFTAAWGPQAIAWSDERRLEQAYLAAAEGSEPDDDDGEAVRERMRPVRAKPWLQMALALLGTLSAIGAWSLGWPQPQDSGGLIWFGLVALLAFPALVMGNALAEHAYPGCRHQARFTRFAMLSLLITGLAIAMQGVALPVDIVAGDAPLSVWALRALAVIQITLAVEWMIRALIFPFLPNRATERLTDSLLLNAITGRQAGPGGGFEDQFGVDISQSWAVQFIRQSSVWLLMILGVATWLTSAITTLRVDERGVYQRMGHVSAELLEPGLHLHLPWPLGSIQRISYGGIQEVRLNVTAEVAAPQVTEVEAPSANHDDRIWSKDHGEELFLMIANQPRLNAGENYESQRPYELYHADVVVTYRVGLAAQDSLRATYHVADAERLVAQIGRRELVDLFNNRTAEDLLFADVSAFSQSHHRAMQERLDALKTGIDVVDVIFEAVHPPVATAATFERVHAAEKESAVQINIARAEAEQRRATAQINAARTNDQARANAFSDTAEARAERGVFAAERRAHNQDSEVFVFERSLQVFEKTFADKNLIIVDPEINAEQGFVVDLNEHARRVEPQN